METDGTGAGFFGERMLSTVPTLYKAHWFFPALSEELRNISFQRPPHGHDTWTRVRAVWSQSEACWARGKLDTTSARFLSKPVSPKCVSHMHIICHLCTVSVLHCVSYTFGHRIYCLMILTYVSSFATTNARVENQTLPSHEPSAQAERLFLRKHGSGSQRRKLAFRSKYNPPLETSVSAENWTVNLL